MALSKQALIRKRVYRRLARLIVGHILSLTLHQKGHIFGIVKQALLRKRAHHRLEHLIVGYNFWFHAKRPYFKKGIF